jgi:hypothetical protein
MARHVHLPSGCTVQIGLKEFRSGKYLSAMLAGRRKDGEENVLPGPKSYDGRYSQLLVQWEECELDIRSSLNAAGGLLLLIQSKSKQIRPPAVVIEVGFLWNRRGTISRLSNGFRVAPEAGDAFDIHVEGIIVEGLNLPTLATYVVASATSPIAISVGDRMSVANVQKAIVDALNSLMASSAWTADQQPLFEAMHYCCAWDTIYDPQAQRVITPVSRRWNCTNGGWVLFCWDTFFASWMIGSVDPSLAEANALAMLDESVEVDEHVSFVPNTSNGHGFRTLDRSQPPVGSLAVREVYRESRNKDFLERAFHRLLKWNRWWSATRNVDGLLALGSTAYTPQVGSYWESQEGGVGGRYGAALESGLDNSPLYDDIPFDATRELLVLHDVGLNSLYIADCRTLAELADILHRPAEANELRAREQSYRSQMQRLWCDKTGMFLNRRIDSAVFSERLAPTHFYALLADVPSDSQASRMINEHLLNENEFWGQWVLPSIARNDPAFPDQAYWRGRIWAPMNFLVYVGLRRYPKAGTTAATGLAARSSQLLLKEWEQHRHVHENYSPLTGQGCDRDDSDAYYHWGGLLGLIGLIEAGRLPGPETPL